MNNSFLRFLLVGGVAAAANWGSRFFFADHMSLGWSVAAAYLVGMTTAYALSRLFVFESSGRTVWDEYLRFAAVNVVAWIQVELITIGLARYGFPAIGFHWHPESVAHAIGVLSPAVTSYLGHRHFTFKRRVAAIAEEYGVLGADAVIKQDDVVGDASGKLPLVVDLDGTLLRTDTLVESFVQGLFSRPLQTLAAVPLLFSGGRAQFKARMVEIAVLDFATLPARHPLIDHLRAEKAAGRTLHLVTAANHAVAHQVAACFDLFDSVHGSPDGVNLKGARKLERLRELFPAGFAYAGDSSADLHVWQGADSIVLAGANNAVASKARKLGKTIEAEFTHKSPSLKTWRKALRLHQWSKNILIFVPLLLSQRAQMPWDLLACVGGFLLTGIAASATYLLNDLADLSADRRHRTKRNRPLASGDLPVHYALIAAPIMLGGALVGAFILSPAFALALLTYTVVTLSYSFRLKRIALLDVLVLGGLYTIRLIMGTVLAEAVFSPWLLTFSGFFFFAMSLAKRHVEVSGASGPPDENLPGRGYRPSDAPLTLTLGVATSVASVLVIVQYMMAEAFPSNVYHLPAALWAAPVLLTLWISRIWLLAHRGELDDDPVAFAVKDRISIGLGAILGLAFVAARLL